MSQNNIRFEDNVAWQKARILTRDIYRISQQGEFARDYGLSVKYSVQQFQ